MPALAEVAGPYWKTCGLPALITRASNNYGPYQFPEKLIPLIIANAIDSRPLPVCGDGKQVRDWLYVDDHAVRHMEKAMLEYLDRRNRDPKPCVWTADADLILGKVE